MHRNFSIRYSFLFISMLVLSLCTVRPQGSKTKIKYDSLVSLDFYNNPPTTAQEGVDSFFVDGVFQGANVKTGISIFMNAYIEDSLQNHYHFDTCTSFINNDTLTIQLGVSSRNLKNILIIYVIDDQFYGFYKNGVTMETIPLNSIELILNNSSPTKGQHLRGHIRVAVETKKGKHYFMGPFFCLIE